VARRAPKIASQTKRGCAELEIRRKAYRDHIDAPNARLPHDFQFDDTFNVNMGLPSLKAALFHDPPLKTTHKSAAYHSL
jgi:hypothetical protein